MITLLHEYLITWMHECMKAQKANNIIVECRKSELQWKSVQTNEYSGSKISEHWSVWEVSRGSRHILLPPRRECHDGRGGEWCQWVVFGHTLLPSRHDLHEGKGEGCCRCVMVLVRVRSSALMWGALQQKELWMADDMDKKKPIRKPMKNPTGGSCPTKTFPATKNLFFFITLNVPPGTLLFLNCSWSLAAAWGCWDTS